ncbi:MAG: Mitochondrial presequence protease [Phylliscum demangeonii]|nr:MAG: Mitochondrial presequence protease [Phylliscum demangeonii]
MRRAKHVPELELTALHLQHDKTGADYLHIARDDKNNVFSIGFRTNPPDDTGVPHILEHTTLCGSQKYPVRDPFFKMLPRTLSNFMNAFTSSDHTFYPFATTNKQDFYNLMSVYLDATLHPLLRSPDFAQEGWRIGPENPSASPDQERGKDRLVFKGVVYNEMKGQTSDASYLFHIKFQKCILPSLNNSGGDPQHITDLTYGQLKAFHSSHYHPSNAKILTYGDLPFETHLQEVAKVIEQFPRIQADEDIKRPISLDTGPHHVTVEGPLDPLVDPSRQLKTSTSWLMCDTSDVLENFSVGVVASLLLDGYGSPLYRNLIEAGIGLDWSPNTGYDGSGKTGIFSIGLTGVKPEDIPRVTEVVDRTLRDIHREGFDRSKVDGILHQLDLALKHKTAQFGLSLMHRLKPAWFNGVDPFDSLAWNDTVSAFKERFAQDRYLESLLEKYLFTDKSLVFTMTPSANYQEELETEESARFARKLAEVEARAGGSEQARQELEKGELELQKIQDKAKGADVSVLPTLKVADIPRERDTKSLRHADVDGVQVQWRTTSTNGLTYFRAINPIVGMPHELRNYIPLFNDAIMRLGTKEQTMEQIEDRIKLKTGGISTSYHLSTSPSDIQTCSEGFAVSGYALDGNVPFMYDLLRTILYETDFDSLEAEGKIRELLQSEASGAVNSIAQSGHSYARRFAEAGLSLHGRYAEETTGLSQVRLIAGLASRPLSEGLGDVIDKLKSIQRLALTSGGSLRVAITAGSESTQMNEEELSKFLRTLPAAPSLPVTDSSGPVSAQPTKTFFRLPYQVYYTGLAMPTVPYRSQRGASLQIVAQLLTHKHLHHEIREKGGAYGGGAYCKGLGGSFGYYSYRDPNPQNTFRIMASAAAWGRDHVWTDGDIREAKLSVFQSLDAPESVSEEGMTQFSAGITEEMQQTRRAQLLDVGVGDIRRAWEYLLEGMEKRQLVVLGEERDWARPEDGWQVVDLGVSPAGVEVEEAS